MQAHIHSVSILSALGGNLEAHHQSLSSCRSGIDVHTEHKVPFRHSSAIVPDSGIPIWAGVSRNHSLVPTRLEKMLLYTIHHALQDAGWHYTDRNLRVILSTTKGNIEDLDTLESAGNEAYTLLPALSNRIKALLGLCVEPILISNACTSGVTALNTAAKIISTDDRIKIVCAGGDLVSAFTLLGFNSLMALDPEKCRPYDKSRKGINLGEGAAAICLSSTPGLTGISLLSGISTNDANHISGPSRTGEGLYQAIIGTLNAHNLTANDIDFINAHGTATIFNDEMESIAFQRAKISSKPLNSFKGCIGHTLGGAGLLETVLCFLSLQRQTVYPSVGFDNPGTSKPLNIIKDTAVMPITRCLKTASGFGGCNAALILQYNGS